VFSQASPWIPACAGMTIYFLKTLFSAGFPCYQAGSSIIAEIQMFNDLFDFGKKRTLKESVGFFLFYALAFVAVGGVLEALGIH
jgi:hypothetical protein